MTYSIFLVDHPVNVKKVSIRFEHLRLTLIQLEHAIVHYRSIACHRSLYRLKQESELLFDRRTISNRCGYTVSVLSKGSVVKCLFQLSLWLSYFVCSLHLT